MLRNWRRPARRGLLVASAALAALALAAPARATVDRPDRGGHGHGHCRNGYVGLTFDDGPSTTTTQLLNALESAGLRATMFNQGNNALTYPDQVRAERRAGMWVGNHTFDHPHLTQIPAASSFQEIASTQWVLADLTHRAPGLFRPPFGETNDEIRATGSRLGLLEVLWTVDSRDWAGASAPEIVTAAATLEPGGIILMHDWPPATIEALPGIAQMLKDRGLCSGRIVHTPRDIPGAGTTFHAVAVKP